MNALATDPDADPAAEWQQLLQAVSRAEEIDAGDLIAVAERVCSTVTRALDLAHCTVWAMDAQQQALHSLSRIDAGGDSGAVFLPLNEAPNYLAALQQDALGLAIADTGKDPRCAELLSAYLRPLTLHAVLHTPFHHQGRLAGVIAAGHRGAHRTWQDEERALLANLAALLGRCLDAGERARELRELQQHNQALERRVEERTLSLQDALARLDATQQQLIEREKLAALGALVAGVAHEVNTPVGVALTATTHGSEALHALRQALQSGAMTRSGLEEALNTLDEALSLATRNIERAAKLISNFKQTAADQTSEKRASFELGAYVDAVVATLSPLLRKRGIAINVESDGYVTLDSYPGAIAHVVSNLISNAVTHGFGERREGGRIRIEIAPQDGHARMRISDNGAGMTEESRRRAFEPFYTTARGRGGTGLGLSIVFNMVKQTLGGRLQLDSAPGRGTQLEILIPLRAPRPGEDTEPDDPTSS